MKITKSQLKNIIEHELAEMGNPFDPWTKDEKEALKAAALKRKAARAAEKGSEEEPDDDAAEPDYAALRIRR